MASRLTPCLFFFSLSRSYLLTLSLSLALYFSPFKACLTNQRANNANQSVCYRICVIESVNRNLTTCRLPRSVSARRLLLCCRYDGCCLARDLSLKNGFHFATSAKFSKQISSARCFRISLSSRSSFDSLCLLT